MNERCFFDIIVSVNHISITILNYRGNAGGMIISRNSSVSSILSNLFHAIWEHPLHNLYSEFHTIIVTQKLQKGIHMCMQKHIN